MLLTFPGTNPSPKLTKESYIIYRSLCHAALPTSCLLDLAVLPSPSLCCLCWCDVPLLAQIPGRLGMALCSTTALHEPPRTAGSVSAPRALLGLAEPHKNLLPALAAQFPSLLSTVLCPLWHRVTDTSLCSLCLSAAFTREGMPVSTFLPLISPFPPFFPCLLPSCWVVLLLQYPDGVWISWS